MSDMRVLFAGTVLDIMLIGTSSVISWPHFTSRVPTATPSKRILPIFNTLAFFGVEPGVSYHSVQEVFTDTSPRLSIQGWYHRSTAPEGAEMASISQLKVTATLFFEPFFALVS